MPRFRFKAINALKLGVILAVIIGLGVWLSLRKRNVSAGERDDQTHDGRIYSERESASFEKYGKKSGGNSQTAAKDSFAKAGELKAKFQSVLSSDRSSQEKIFECSSLVGQLSQYCSSEEILSFLNETVGDGSIKSGVLPAVFSTSKNDVGALLALMKTLKGADAQLAQIGLYDNITRSAEPGKNLADLFVANLPGMENGLITAIRVDLENQNDGEMAKARYLNLMQVAGNLPEDKKFLFLSTLAKAAMNKMPFEVWKSVTSASFPNDNSAGLNKLKDEVTKSMLAENPKKAIAAIVEEGTSVGLLESGLNYWLNTNPKDASAWFESNAANLNASQVDAVRAAFADHSLKSGDLDSARQILSQISDPGTKKKAEGRIWGVERDLLRKEVGKDPAGTIQAILSGQSKFGDYWLEEAMGTWVAKDFDKAQGWYQRNWDSLPANKAQFVAAAFANQAVTQGDTATARQWMTYIQDPKTKQRIEAGIAKAEEKAQ